MEQNKFDLNNTIYSNNNILLEIVNDLQKLMNYSKDNLTIATLGNIINRMNYIINENKTNLELIKKDINKMYNQIDKKFDDLIKNNTHNNKEFKYKDGRYFGQVINGVEEGKGILYYNNGDRYEGDWRNGKVEGKGIKYFSNDDKYEGDFRNGKFEGKGIYYFNNGDRYEGDFRNDNFDGKGIKYFNNGDRRMGDYLNGKKIGKHIILTKNGEVKTKNY